MSPTDHLPDGRKRCESTKTLSDVTLRCNRHKGHGTRQRHRAGYMEKLVMWTNREED